MLRPLSDLPSGVIGFEAVGEVHSDDYRDVLRPAIDSAAAAGPVRFVYVLGPEFTGYSAGASWEDSELVRDDNLITSRNPGDLPAFSTALTEALAR